MPSARPPCTGACIRHRANPWSGKLIFYAQISVCNRPGLARPPRSPDCAVGSVPNAQWRPPCDPLFSAPKALFLQISALGKLNRCHRSLPSFGLVGQDPRTLRAALSGRGNRSESLNVPNTMLAPSTAPPVTARTGVAGASNRPSRCFPPAWRSTREPDQG